MRIEMILPTLEVGGMERMTASLAKGLASRGHQVSVICLNELGELESDLVANGISCTLIRAPGAISNLWAPSLYRHFRLHQPDVVHTHSGAWGRAAWAARLSGVKRRVHTVHGILEDEPWFDGGLKRWEAAHSDVVVSVSDALDSHLATKIGISSHKRSVIINGVDTTLFAPNESLRQRMRADLSLSNRVCIGTVARLVPGKNIPALLLAVATLRDRGCLCDTVIVGDGPEMLRLRALSDQLNISNHTHFLGLRQDTSAILSALDVFVLPSLAEGTSISILEAMSTGLAVLATPVGGNPHLLDYGRAGLVADSTDSQDLTSCLEALVMDADKRTSLGLAARNRAIDVFSQASMIRAYESLYRADA